MKATCHSLSYWEISILKSTWGSLLLGIIYHEINENIYHENNMPAFFLLGNVYLGIIIRSSLLGKYLS